MTTIYQPMLPENTFKKKVVVITGGGTGLGKNMAQALLQLGATVVITSRKKEVLDATALELQKFTGGVIHTFACDVRDYRQIEQLLAFTIETCGRVDALVNNAAGNFISPTENLSPKAFDVVVDIVLKGTYNGVLTFGKYWLESKQQATILSIVTTYATTGSAFVVPSATAKAGVIALTRSLAVEWGKRGIRLNAIAPGPFPTEGAWSRLFPGHIEEKFNPENRIPLGRYGKHEELMNLVTYLLSDYSGYINGEVVTIDGGEWLQGAGEFNNLLELTKEDWQEIEKQIRGKS
jgi:NAD(P)-dependent dehydrogenase (short-subunit alcohol dehydrogenase family)